MTLTTKELWEREQTERLKKELKKMKGEDKLYWWTLVLVIGFLGLVVLGVWHLIKY